MKYDVMDWKGCYALSVCPSFLMKLHLVTLSVTNEKMNQSHTISSALYIQVFQEGLSEVYNLYFRMD